MSQNNDSIHRLFMIQTRFDAREELDRAVRDLEYSTIHPINSPFIRRPEEEAREAREQRDRTLALIDFAQQSYLAELESARKTGVLINEDYRRALLDAQSPFSHFDRMKREAQSAYREVVKFDF